MDRLPIATALTKQPADDARRCDERPGQASSSSGEHRRDRDGAVGRRWAQVRLVIAIAASPPRATESRPSDHAVTLSLMISSWAASRWRRRQWVARRFTVLVSVVGGGEDEMSGTQPIQHVEPVDLRSRTSSIASLRSTRPPSAGRSPGCVAGEPRARNAW